MNTLKNVGKRVVALVLALMMCVGMLATTAFAEDVPEVKGTETSEVSELDLVEAADTREAGSTARKVCCGLLWNQVCDKIDPATCGSYAIKHMRCKECGATWTKEDLLSQKPDHTWSTGNDIKVTTKPTCVAIGTGHHYCKSCGASKLDVVRIPELGHNWVITKDAVDLGNIGSYDTDVSHTVKCTNCKILLTASHAYAPATCTAPETCACGHVKLGSKAQGHSFTNYVPNNDATCTADGTKTAQCDRCTETDTKPDEGSQKDHSYTGAIQKIDENQHGWLCVNGCNQVGNATDHVYTGWTENSDGSRTGTCACGATKTVEAPAHQCVYNGDLVDNGDGTHSYKCTAGDGCILTGNATAHTGVGEQWNYESDAASHWIVCACGAKFAEGNHTTEKGWNADDDEHWKVCGVCGNAFDRAAHDWSDWTKVGDNYTHSCTVCGKTETANGETDHTHTEDSPFAVTVEGYAATCTETGLTAGVKCGLCDEWITEQKTIDALNHDFGDWYTVTAAQVGVAGLERHDCRREGCGASETRRIDPLPGTGGGDGGDVVIDDTNPPLGGDPDGGDGEVELDDGEIPLAGPVTRAEFVDYLYRREGSPEAALSTFVDVPADHEYASAIGWGQVNDIAWGISETEFAPDELVTVEQVKLFLSRYAAFKGIEMPELAALVGLDDQDPAMNCDEILGEFFGADE